jgi:Phage tail assembly chaperone protein
VQYAKILNDEIVIFPYTWEMLFAENPSTNFGVGLLQDLYEKTDQASDGSVVVEVTEEPDPTDFDLTKKIQISTTPVLKNTKWVLEKTIVSKTSQELQQDTLIKSIEIRTARNNLLQSCDWTQLADATDFTKAAWKNYRQQLRDLPDQAGFPWTVTWPDFPPNNIPEPNKT